MRSYLSLLIEGMSDTTHLILIAAAGVSLIVGLISSPEDGWIEGTAIFVAVVLVANISAGNDYSKQLQFKALEATSADDERTSVLREGEIERINPKYLVVGDLLVLQVLLTHTSSSLTHMHLCSLCSLLICLSAHTPIPPYPHTLIPTYPNTLKPSQAGDSIPADSILISHQPCLSNESSLTGEPDDMKKDRNKDCFLLSSCTITEGEEARAVVVGIGPSSQWGKIKANLVTESVNTPLQDKLEDMTKVVSLCSYAVLCCCCICMSMCCCAMLCATAMLCAVSCMLCR
jgi:magnesium-transporting ATPase (P-type)